MAMIERVYGHFRNQSYQEAQAGLTGNGQHEGFDLGCLERTNKARNRVDCIRSLAVPSVPIHHSAKEPEKVADGRLALSGGGAGPPQREVSIRPPRPTLGESMESYGRDPVATHPQADSDRQR